MTAKKDEAQKHQESVEKAQERLAAANAEVDEAKRELDTARSDRSTHLNSAEYRQHLEDNPDDVDPNTQVGGQVLSASQINDVVEPDKAKK